MNKFIILFLTGGLGYCALEILWRGYTHWTMFFLGGFCFYSLFIIFSRMENAHIILKAIIGGSVITVAEFVTGCIVNLLLKWNVWSYSSSPYNLLGQICLPYTILWMLLCIPIAFLFNFFHQYVR